MSKQQQQQQQQQHAFVVVRGHDDPAHDQRVEDQGGFVIAQPYENEARTRGVAPADPTDAVLSAAPLPA